MAFKEKFKNFFKKFWNLLWKDDTWKGWLFSIVFIFVFIKFIFFPLLSLATGTTLPLAIVESCSMYHNQNLLSNYNTWWTQHYLKYEAQGINKSTFDKFGFHKGFTKGDILFITRANPATLKVGDIIIFDAGRTNPLIHRIVKIETKDGKKIFSTMGDNNNGQLDVEKQITEEQLIGKASLRIMPYAGWLKLIFFEGSKSPSERGLCKEN
jgi:signal peptidase I